MIRPLDPVRYGVSRIIGDASGTFQFFRHGTWATYVGATDHRGRLTDLVAWNDDAPGWWWTRLGNVVALGEAEIHRAEILNLPLHLFATPYAWLMNHGPKGRWPAACIVDWTSDPRLLLNGVDVKCDDPALVRRLEEAQRRHDRPLRISAQRRAA